MEPPYSADREGLASMPTYLVRDQLERYIGWLRRVQDDDDDRRATTTRHEAGNERVADHRAASNKAPLSIGHSRSLPALVPACMYSLAGRSSPAAAAP